MSKILIVDDEPDIVNLTSFILEKEGYEVIVAEDAKDCRAQLKKDRPDLILLDVMLPGEDGWELSKKIKANKDTKSIPIVMFTVRASLESKEKSLYYANADAQIDKPFKTEDLLKIINDFLK